MVKVLYDDDDKLVSLDSMPTNWRTAPQVGELNDGIDWSLHVVAPFDLDTQASNTIAQRAIGEPTNTEVLGRRNASGTLDYFRHYNEDGQPDPATDIVHEAVKVRGAMIYLARREGGKPADAPFAVGDEVSIWECEVDEIQTPKEEGYRRGRAPLTVKRFMKSVTVVADVGQ